MGSSVALANLTLSDTERSKSRSPRFSLVGDLYIVHMPDYRSTVILIRISHIKAVYWRAGFSAVSAVFLVKISIVRIPHITLRGLLTKFRTSLK